MTASHPRAAELLSLVRRAARHPHFAEKYRHVELEADVDFSTVPEMTREDVTRSSEQVVASTARPASAYLFTSGGSTAEPKLAWIPSDMYLGALLPYWRPLESSDVLANLAMPGRLWSAHYFYNRVAERAGADVIGLGSIPEEELAQWLAFLRRHRTTALACTPSQLAGILAHCEQTGDPFMEGVRTVIWFGEPLDAELLATCARSAPWLRLWGNYGATETWVIGHNGPDCAPDTFHVLPHQHIEVVDGRVLVTTMHPAAVSPVIRYRIGDRGAWSACRCGRANSTLRLLAREDSHVKFAGTLVSPQELVSVARSVPGVRAAQVALVTGAGPADERLEVHVVADRHIPEQALRDRLLASQIDLRFGLRGNEDAIRIRFVERLATSEQTAKTPALLRQAAA
jgi:phenylacetate-coenzyme A ligase PaaK-like adenylate-forming protein